MTDFGRRPGEMLKSDYDPDEDGIIAVAQTEAVKYVDRGDPADYDFTLTDFTTDDTWRDLDLSAIVPAGVLTVHIYMWQLGVEAGANMWFRENGNSNTVNVRRYVTPYAAAPCGRIAFVNCDANRVIEYRISNSTWITLSFSVLGWLV